MMGDVLPVQTLMEELEPEEQFLQCARNGDLPGIQRLLMSKIKEETRININCKGRGAASPPPCCSSSRVAQSLFVN